MEEEPIEIKPPEKVVITKKFTLKDYYDIRNLRLLYWGLKTELCDRFGIPKGCEVADEVVKPAIEEKLEEIKKKLR